MSKEDRAREVLASAIGSESSVGEAVSRATEGTGAQTWVAVRALSSMIEDKKATIVDPSPPRFLFEYLGSSYSLWFWGTMSAVALTIASVYGPPVVPFLIYARYVFGALSVLFLPGYTLIEALYPKKEDLDGLERLALSIGLSLALVPLVGLLLNYTPWGIRLDPIIVSLTLLDLSLALVGASRKESYIRLASTASS
jgi:hypothetical protein